MRAARQAAAQSDETDGAVGDWLQGRGDCIVLSLHVQPGAKTTAVAGLHGAALKIRLAAPPVDGKANACLLAYLAELLGVPVSDIGVADNFFDLGGSSLLAMRFVDQAKRRFGVRIAPQHVVAGTLRQVAERAEAVEALASGDEAKEAAQPKGVFARLFRRGAR